MLELLILLLDAHTDADRDEQQDASDHEQDDHGRDWLLDRGLVWHWLDYFVVIAIKADVTSLAVIQSNVVALQKLIAEDVSLFRSILGLAIHANLAVLVSGIVLVSEYGV